MTKERVLTSIVSFFFFLVIVTDFCFKYSRIYLGETVKFLPITKSLIAIVFLSALWFIKLIKKKDIYVLILITAPTIIHLFLSNPVDIRSFLYIIGKYVFGIIIMLFIFRTRKILSENILVNSLICLSIINFTCIISGYFFDIYIFETYTGERFGYNGIFKSTSVASYFYMFTLTYICLKPHKSFFDNTWIILLLVSSIFVGSKSLLAFLFLIFFMILIKYLSKRQAIISEKFFYMISSVFGLILTFLLINFYFFLNPTFNQILTEQGFLTAFFSFRDIIVINVFNAINDGYQFSDFLFGGVFKLDTLTETALLDLFLTFGLAGTFFYIYFIKYNLPKIYSPFTQFVLSFIVLLILLRGNFLYYPSVLFVSFFVISLILNQERQL